MNNRVSVILPSYNHSKFIIDSLESVLSQTYRNFEFVILDDASSDKSAFVIEKFIQEHPEVNWRFIQHQENLGGVISLNHLVETAQGEYIALINSDDIWYCEKLERQVSFLDANPTIGAVFAQATLINTSGDNINHVSDFSPHIFIQKNRSRGKWLRKLFFDLNCFCHPSIMIRKSVYDQIGLYDPRYRQLPDMAMWIRLLKYTDIHIIEEPLVKFRIHAGNTSKVQIQNTKRNLNELSIILDEFLEGIPNDVFIDGFGDLFKNKGASTDEELACEKAFLFFIPENPLKSLYNHIGLLKFYQLLGNNSTQNILQSRYSFSFGELNELAGLKFFDETLLTSIYPLASPLDHGNDQLSLRYVMALNMRFVEALIRSHPILFKPLSIIRKIFRPSK